MRLLMDGKNAAKAAFHVNGKLRASDGLQTGLATNFLAQIRNVLNAYPDITSVYVLWETHETWRHHILPSYKDNRNREEKELKPDDNDWRKQINVLMHLLPVLPIRFTKGDLLEADDLAYLMREPGTPTMLHSGDYDWLQLIDDSTSCNQTRVKRVVTLDNLEDATGYRSGAEIIDVFSICGDAGDRIPGVEGVGEKTAIKFSRGQLGSHLQTYKNIMAWKANPEGYARSRTLFELTQVPEHLRAGIVTQINELDQESFVGMAKRMEWNTVLKDVEKWLAPFRRLS